MTRPPYLKPGDTIALTCPAGYMPRENVSICIQTLQQWGYNVEIGNTVGGDSKNYFSGTDDERLNELQRYLDDPDIHAILCGRGGYGLSRIVDRIDFKTFEANPKWVIGFSDVTVLHSHIWANCKIATLHAPMAGAFNDGGADSDYVQSLRHALAGEAAAYTSPAHPFFRKGKATGRLIGGNLSLLAHLIGTSSDIKTKGKIFFLEDVGEYLYNVDRMLHQLKRNGKFDNLAGLIIGGFTDLKDTTRPFGATVEEIIRDVVDEYDYPICFGFPVSHGRENFALKIGVKHTLDVSADAFTLTEV
ncbi:MAG: LD-carboxypeptidase [Bacteroidetes bacterium]|nr:LD-carboxypeptidase [Bacteroidota bacterium]